MSLATYIEQDLEARIRRQMPLPGPLTLQGLARHYDVSLTPVREAIDALVHRGLLLKMGNRRLVVNTACADESLDGQPLATPAPPKNWDAILTQHVLLESLRGEAIFLREEALAERYTIGRTMLRQIFGRLAGAGILDHVPRRGWRVRPLKDADLASYLDIRETLEIRALELAAPRLAAADLEAMLEGNTPLTGDSAPRIDNQLHQYLIEKSENRYIRDFFARHGGYYRALFDYAALGAEVVSDMAEQHRTILRQLLAQDWPAASEALAEHIRSQAPNVRQMMRLLDRDSLEAGLPAAVTP